MANRFAIEGDSIGVTKGIGDVIGELINGGPRDIPLDPVPDRPILPMRPHLPRPDFGDLGLNEDGIPITNPTYGDDTPSVIPQDPNIHPLIVTTLPGGGVSDPIPDPSWEAPQLPPVEERSPPLLQTLEQGMRETTPAPSPVTPGQGGGVRQQFIKHLKGDRDDSTKRGITGRGTGSF